MTITEADLANARTAWGNGLVAISKAYDDQGIDGVHAIAGDILDSLYGFEFGPILFKPTLSGGAQTFRTDRDGTLSYFIGHNDAFPADSGFKNPGVRCSHKQPPSSRRAMSPCGWAG